MQFLTVDLVTVTLWSGFAHHPDHNVTVGAKRRYGVPGTAVSNLGLLSATPAA
jgi:hypothetical protein